MKKFLRNIMLFFIPVFLLATVFVLLYFVVKETGELDNIVKNIEKQ